MNDENNFFCPNHTLNESKICRNEKDLREVQADIRRKCERFEERFVAQDNHDTETHGNIYDKIDEVRNSMSEKIDSKVTLKTVGILLGTIVTIGMAVIGYQNIMITSNQKAQKEVAHKIGAKIESMNREVVGVSVKISAVQSDVNHLKSDVSKLERKVDSIDP